MSQKRSSHRSMARSALASSRLAALALPLFLQLGCWGSSEPEPTDTEVERTALSMACRPIPAMEEVHWSPFSAEVGVGFGAGSTGLYVTHDGGASWRREPYNWDTRFPSAASGFTPSQVVFLDAEHWVVTGAITRGGQANLTIISRAIGTRDGGLSFTPIFEGSDDTTEVAYPQDTTVRPFGQAADGVFKIDEQRLVAVARGLLFGSVDGGQTFHTVRIFGRWGRWEPSAPRLGLSPGEEVNWQVIHPDGLGLVFHPFGVAVTRDAGLSFEVLEIDSVRRAWLDPLGRVLVWPAGSESRTILVFEKRDGLWYRRPLVSASARVEDILRFDPDGSFVARLEGQGSLTLARFEVDGDDHTVRELDIEAGLSLREALSWSTAAGRERLLVRGTGAGAETRALCEVGEPPIALLEAGLPPDLAPGEMATYARRHDASGSWDRMAFDAAGHVYVASRRALWGGPTGSAAIFVGGQKAPADWRPNAETAEFPEVSGVAVMADGTVAFGLNFFVGRTMRRVLFIDPATRQVRRWQELVPFDDGEGGYSDGDIYRLTALGELVFAATGLGTADLSAAATLGPGQLQVGLPGLGVPLENGTYHYLTSRRPMDGQHQIGRASLYDGTLPREGCEDCLSYPGLIQGFAVAPATSEGGDELVYVLDRRRGEVYERAFPKTGEDGGTWSLVARGFFDPADIVVREVEGSRLVAVLDGDVFVFRPDPRAVAVRGLQMRAGPGEFAPALGRSELDTGCVAGSPCIEAVNYLPADDPLAGWVLVDPAEEGRLCFKGSGLGDTEGMLWFEETPATVTLWSDSQACGHVAPGAVNDGLVHLETAGGLRSNPLPYVAPARDPVFSLRTDRPMQTGDIVHIEAENLGTVGHAIIGGTILGLRGERLGVLIDAAFPGRMTFRKRPSTAIWWRDIAVFPTQLVGAVAGTNELGGVSGHLGTGATWTLDGQVLPSGPTGDWFEAVSQGPHTLRATYNGRTRDVEVWRVPWDTHHHGPLHPDEVALAPHRQDTATLAGQAYTLVRSSGWQRPGGPSGQLVPGIAEVVAYASKPREGEGPFIPGQAFDREARFGELDEDYDRSRDMPRIIELEGSVIIASRAVEMNIELDNQGVPTVTSFRDVIPVTARLTQHHFVDGAVVSEALGEVQSDLNEVDEGRVAGLGVLQNGEADPANEGSNRMLWVAFSDGVVTRLVGGPPDTTAAWSPLGELAGDWEVRSLGEDLVFVKPGPTPSLLRGQVTELGLTTVEVPLMLGGVAASDLMAWRIEPAVHDDGQGEGLLVALRMTDGTERGAELGADLVELARVDAALPGVEATYEVNGHTVYGVADVIRYEGELFAALAGGENEPRSGLWIARLSDSALTRELASVEVDTIRCLGPYPRTPGSCGSGVSPNTQGCTYFACPRLERMWLPQEGGAVEVARLAVDADGLQVTYAVRFPEGWSRDLLDRGRIRTAVFVEPPFDTGTE